MCVCEVCVCVCVCNTWHCAAESDTFLRTKDIDLLVFTCTLPKSSVATLQVTFVSYTSISIIQQQLCVVSAHERAIKISQNVTVNKRRSHSRETGKRLKKTQLTQGGTVAAVQKTDTVLP